jgi:putative heme degradation protein
MTVLVADAHAQVQKLVLVVKLATVLECATEEQRSVMIFVGKRLNAKDIHKGIFPVNGGKCLSRKAVHNWVANVSPMTKRLKRRCGSG